MDNISGFGLIVNVIGSVTFPVGIVIPQFADDADPFDLPSIQVADSAMGLNGDLITWSKPNPIKVSLNVIPGSLSDDLLSILLEANRIGKGKFSANDVITMTAMYQSLQTLQIIRTVTLTNGIITNGMPAISVASSGRMKSKIFEFAFENKIGA